MITVNINEVKTNLSHYIKIAMGGDKIMICNHNTPVVELSAVKNRINQKRKLGICKDKIILPKNFNKTSPAIIKSFYESNI
jgi:antitoxin (DNA-binding transcriptional repressor) of toxin-antitoxin stability system